MDRLQVAEQRAASDAEVGEGGMTVLVRAPARPRPARGGVLVARGTSLPVRLPGA
ncbi:hypothetical protein [Streptomyces shenzhenensis]|uniref:hypothetical protein n=1 Tax=Streptomyces shenzhenensis TaxID=943815 RepID=UPI0015F0B323|nr:hypothetical protein [Streptomyces shenzhenensis]